MFLYEKHGPNGNYINPHFLGGLLDQITTTVTSLGGSTSFNHIDLLKKIANINDDD